MPFYLQGSDKGHETGRLVAGRVHEALFARLISRADDAPKLPESSPRLTWLLGLHVATTACLLQLSLPAVSQAILHTQSDTPRCLPRLA